MISQDHPSSQLPILALCGVLSFLAGSVPFGLLIGRRYGKDVRAHGSGNIGFSNAVRTLGWKAALPVLLGDMAKGCLPTWIGLSVAGLAGGLLSAAASVAGHIFPPWLRFRGGKGVATLLGASLALDGHLGLIAAGIWLAVLAATRTSSLASLCAALSLLLVSLRMHPDLAPFFAITFAAILLTHRRNVQDLIRGKERRL